MSLETPAFSSRHVRLSSHARLEEVEDHLGQLDAQVVAFAPACTATGMKLLKIELLDGARSKLRGLFNSIKHVPRYR